MTRFQWPSRSFRRAEGASNRAGIESAIATERVVQAVAHRIDPLVAQVDFGSHSGSGLPSLRAAHRPHTNSASLSRFRYRTLSTST